MLSQRPSAISAPVNPDGEGGFTVYGTLLPAQPHSLNEGYRLDSRTVLR